MITQERLIELLSYDPDTGDFKRRIGNKIVRSAHKRGENLGYIRIGVGGKRYRAHRLAFLYVAGFIPERIDHIDGNGYNNRWDNLRPCTQSENCANHRASKVNTSGFKGVHWNRRDRKWQARIGYNGARLYIGSFDHVEIAAAAYGEEARKLFGSFARADR